MQYALMHTPIFRRSPQRRSLEGDPAQVRGAHHGLGVSFDEALTRLSFIV
jgi:predicted transcriptional regulator with HTH domain